LEQLVGFLASRRAPVAAVKAVVLTHHHDDHRGNAERLRNQAGARVLVHQDDLASATRETKPPRFPLWKPRVLHDVLHCLAGGVARTVPVVAASSFRDEEVLDVPGRPRVIHAPGHTPGNAAMSLEDRDVLMVGDALATIDLVSGESGPRLLPRFVNDDHQQALASLHKLELVKAGWVLPGHGPPGRGVRSRRSSWPGRWPPRGDKYSSADLADGKGSLAMVLMRRRASSWAVGIVRPAGSTMRARPPSGVRRPPAGRRLEE
jgi:glyoxylase-like metal-dependent hydrolase (beta-lactamase superfamily II)